MKNLGDLRAQLNLTNDSMKIAMEHEKRFWRHLREDFLLEFLGAHKSGTTVYCNHVLVHAVVEIYLFAVLASKGRFAVNLA